MKEVKLLIYLLRLELESSQRIDQIGLLVHPPIKQKLCVVLTSAPLFG